MVIDISLELLNKLKLNPNEFLLMELLRKKEYVLAAEFLKNNYNSAQSIEIYTKLLSLGYFTSNSFLENSYGYANVKVSNSYKGLVKTEDMFDEFVEEYPKSVIRTDGTTDYLRVDLKTAKLYYVKATRGLRSSHEHLLECLKFEVEERMKDGSIKFMPRITKWLSSQAWSTYQDRLMDAKSNSVGSTKYGTEIE
jgi:hypothetical protein